MSLLVKQLSFAAIDFESAPALSSSEALPIQVGIAIMKEEQILLEESFSSYLNPLLPIKPPFQSRTGKASSLQNSSLSGHFRPVATLDKKRVTQNSHQSIQDRLTHSPTLLSLWPRLSSLLDHRPLVAHGHGTERRFLRAFPLHRFGPWIDTLSLSRYFIAHAPSYQLSTLIRFLKLEDSLYALYPSLCWHEALSDAIAALVLLRYLIQSYRLGNLSLVQLATLTKK